MSNHVPPVGQEAEKLKVFDEEFMPHIEAMYNFAYHITNDEDEAKDLVQETYLKAFRFMNSFQQGTNAKAWLFRILKNNFINDFRKKSKEPAKIDFQEVEEYCNTEEGKHEEAGSIAVNAFKDSIGDEVTSALNSMALDFRIVIILCDIEGFTYEEMAKILDIPIGTVRSRLHRARGILRERLGEYARSLGYDK